jgi:hypothetical protein
MYNIVEAWFWGLHWRVKGKKDFDALIQAREHSKQLERVLSFYDREQIGDKNGK